MADDQTFYVVVSQCKMNREFCCFFTGRSLENHKFQAPVGLPVWNFGRPRVNGRRPPLAPRHPLGSNLDHELKIDIITNLLTLNFNLPSFKQQAHSRPLPSSPKPLFQSEATCKAIDVKIISFYSHELKLIFTRKILHLASSWKWGFMDLFKGLWNSEMARLWFSSRLRQLLPGCPSSPLMKIIDPLLNPKKT